MEEGLLFDGVDVNRYNFAVYEAVQSSLTVLTYRAYAPVAFFDDAVVAAKSAAHVSAVNFFIYHRFFHFS